MSMYGIEQVIDQAVDALKAGMVTKVAALNAEYADEYVMTVPADTSYEVVFDKETAQRLWSRGGYPAIVIEPVIEKAVGDVAFDDEYAVEHRIQVSTVVQLADWRSSQTLLMRYLRAVKELLSPQDSLACGACRYEGGGFKSEFKLSENEVLRDIAALFTVTTYQRPA